MLVVSHIVHNVASLLRTIGNGNSEKISKQVLCLLLKAVNNSSQSKGSVTTLRKIEILIFHGIDFCELIATRKSSTPSVIFETCFLLLLLRFRGVLF
jgi:hypothetical protein